MVEPSDPRCWFAVASRIERDQETEQILSPGPSALVPAANEPDHRQDHQDKTYEHEPRAAQNACQRNHALSLGIIERTSDRMARFPYIDTVTVTVHCSGAGHVAVGAQGGIAAVDWSSAVPVSLAR